MILRNRAFECRTRRRIVSQTLGSRGQDVVATQQALADVDSGIQVFLVWHVTAVHLDPDPTKKQQAYGHLKNAYTDLKANSFTDCLSELKAAEALTQ